MLVSWSWEVITPTLLCEIPLRFEDQNLNGPGEASSKHGCQGFCLFAQDARDLACELVSLSIVVDLKHALLEIIPFESAMLHAVLAELHVESIGELAPHPVASKRQT